MSLKAQWKRFAGAPAGERFERRYQQRKQKGGSKVAGILMVVAGIVLVVVGAVLLVIPGPGIPVVAVGGALIGSEFRWAARLLDRLELKLRAVVQWLKKQRRRFARA